MHTCNIPAPPEHRSRQRYRGSVSSCDTCINWFWCSTICSEPGCWYARHFHTSECLTVAMDLMITSKPYVQHRAMSYRGQSTNLRFVSCLELLLRKVYCLLCLCSPSPSPSKRAVPSWPNDRPDRSVSEIVMRRCRCTWFHCAWSSPTSYVYRT